MLTCIFDFAERPYKGIPGVNSVTIKKSAANKLTVLNNKLLCIARHHVIIVLNILSIGFYSLSYIVC